MTLVVRASGLNVEGRLGPLNASIHSGVWLHLVGPNGAGKSTLLACIAGLMRYDGEVSFLEQSLSSWSGIELARRRAWLSQQQHPPWAMPVWHYLQLHQTAGDAERVMYDLTRKLGLENKLTRSLHQLSGGEWQRVRLAAVILQIHPDCQPDGQLLLLDEPMNSLDVAQQHALSQLLGGLCEAGIAVVMSSHDLNHSLRYAHQAWILNKGLLLAAGASHVVLTPGNLAQAWQLPFQMLQVEGHRLLVTAL